MKKLFLGFLFVRFIFFIFTFLYFLNISFAQSVCHPSCTSGLCFAPEVELSITVNCCMPPFRGDENPQDGNIHTFSSVTIEPGATLSICQRTDAFECESQEICTIVNEARGNLHIQTVTSFVNKGIINLEGRGEGRIPIWIQNDTDVLQFVNSPNLLGRGTTSTIVSRQFTMLRIYANTILDSTPTSPNQFFSFIRDDFSDFEVFSTPSPANPTLTLRFEVSDFSRFNVYLDEMLINTNVSLSDTLNSISTLDITSTFQTLLLSPASDLGSGTNGLTGTGCSNVRTAFNLGLSTCNDISGKVGGIAGNAGSVFYLQTPSFDNRQGMIIMDGQEGSNSEENSGSIVNGNGTELDGDTFIGNDYNYVDVENQGGRGSNGVSGFLFAKSRETFPGFSNDIIYSCASNNCQSDTSSIVTRMPIFNPNLLFTSILNLDQILFSYDNPSYLFSVPEVGYQFTDSSSLLDYRYFPITSVAYQFTQLETTTLSTFLCVDKLTANCQMCVDELTANCPINNNLLSEKSYDVNEQKMNWFLSSNEIQSDLYSSLPFPLFRLDDGVSINLEFILRPLGGVSRTFISNLSFYIDQYAPCDHVSDECEIKIYDLETSEKNYREFSSEVSKIAAVNNARFLFDISILDRNQFSTIETSPVENNIKLITLAQKGGRLYTVSKASTIIQFTGFSRTVADMHCNSLLSSSGPWNNIETIDIRYDSNIRYSTEDISGPGQKMGFLTTSLLAHLCPLLNEQLCNGEIWVFSCIKDQAENWSRIISTEQSGAIYSSSILSRLPVVINNYNIRESLDHLATYSYPLDMIFSGSIPLETLTFDQFSSTSEVIDLGGEYSLKSFIKIIFDFSHDLDDTNCLEDPCQVLDIRDNNTMEKIVFSRDFYSDTTPVIAGVRLPSDFSGIKNVWFYINASEPNIQVNSREDLQFLLGTQIAEHNTVLCNTQMPERFRSQVNFCFEVGVGNFDNQFLYIWLEDVAGNINVIYNARRRLPVDTLPPFEPITTCVGGVSDECSRTTVPFSFLSVNPKDLFAEHLYISSTDTTSNIWAYKVCFWRYDSGNTNRLSDEQIRSNILSNNGECPSLESFAGLDVSLSRSRTWCIRNPLLPNILLLDNFPLLCQGGEDVFCEDNIMNKISVCYLEGGTWQYTIIAVDTAENRSPVKVGSVITLNLDRIEFEIVEEAPYLNSITSSISTWQEEEIYDFIDGDYSFSIRYKPDSTQFCTLSGLPQVWIDIDGSCREEVTSGSSLNTCISDDERFLMNHLSGTEACQEDISKSLSEISRLGNFDSNSISLNYNTTSKGRMYYLFVINDSIVSDIFSIDFLPYSTRDLRGDLQVRNNIYQPGSKFPVILVKTNVPTDRVQLSILDPNGRHMRWIYKNVEYQSVPFYVEWNLKDDNSKDVTSGLYYAVLKIFETNGGTRKEYLPIILIR